MSSIRFRLLLLGTACALSGTGAAWAANSSSMSDARKTYLEDRAFCMSGQSQQDEHTCLREAGAALDEAKGGRLKDPETNFEQNRFARCAYHKDPLDEQYCERRMRGEGQTSGSVESGAILRELVVTVPAS